MRQNKHLHIWKYAYHVFCVDFRDKKKQTKYTQQQNIFVFVVLCALVPSLEQSSMEW